jgi:hypothetical protein
MKNIKTFSSAYKEVWALSSKYDSFELITNSMEQNVSWKGKNRPGS